MTSPDGATNFFQSVVPTTGPATGGGATMTLPPGVSAPAGMSQAVDWQSLAMKIARVGPYIGAAGADIGQYRGGMAAASAAQKAGKAAANQVMQQGFKTAARARAVVGAQGTTEKGSPINQEMSIINDANLEARNRIYEGNIQAYYSQQRAIAALYKTPQDLLRAVMAGQIDPKKLSDPYSGMIPPGMGYP